MSSMSEDSPLNNIYVGMITTAVETLTEIAQETDYLPDFMEFEKAVNTIRFQAVLDLVSIANQLRNQDRLDTIVADKELAVAYFAAGKALSQ